MPNYRSLRTNKKKYLFVRNFIFFGITFLKMLREQKMQNRTENQNLRLHNRTSQVPPAKAASLRSAFSNPYSKVTVCRVQMSRALTEKQIQRLFAIAHTKRWSRQEVQAWVEKTFWKRNLTELTRFEYDRTCSFILENPAPHVWQLRA